MNDQSDSRQTRDALPVDAPRRTRLVPPRQWELWQRRPRTIGYFLACELATVVAIAVVLPRVPAPAGIDWLRFGVLALCATIHIQLSRRQEERRRNPRKPTVHIDLTSIWSFPAVVVLPIHLALLLILLSRTQRWFVARRPLYRFTFSATSMLLATLLTHLLLVGIEPEHWSNLNELTTAREFAVLVVAGAFYGAAQAVIIGLGAVMLSDSKPTLRTVLGTRQDNELEAVTIALGVITAILLVSAPPALVIMVLISIVGNRIAEVRQLQVDVRTDPKTGLYNMRGWHEAAQRALDRAGRGNQAAALLMVDLDHFKSINDTWGHPAGDDVLGSVADALRESTRPTDVVGRFGGEEFVLLLPEIDPETAAEAAERVRAAVAALRVDTTDKRGNPAAITDRTASVGVAVFPKDAANLTDLLQAADAAVYEAKERGRNQVRLAGPTRTRPS